MGRSSSEPWSAEEIYQFRSFYYMFREACLRQDIQPLAVPEAFLMYVKIFGYGESRDKLSSQIGAELEKIRPEVRNRIEGTGGHPPAGGRGQSALPLAPLHGKAVRGLSPRGKRRLLPLGVRP